MPPVKRLDTGSWQVPSMVGPGVRESWEEVVFFEPRKKGAGMSVRQYLEERAKKNSSEDVSEPYWYSIDH